MVSCRRHVRRARQGGGNSCARQNNWLWLDSRNKQRWARATFFESSIAIPQLEGSTSAIAIPHLFKEMLLRNHNSAIPQSQFFLMSATSSPQLESFFPQFSAYFLPWNPVGVHEKKSEIKSLMQLSI
jgi:hypothetical protein